MAVNLALRITGNASGANAALQSVQGQANATSQAVNAIGTVARSVITTLGGMAAVGGFVNVIVESEKLTGSLVTMTGGLNEAGQAFNALEQFAAKTPFTIDQSVEAFIRMRSLGLNPTESAMTSFGNTAAAMGKDLMQYVEAVADASTGEFERLKEFGIKASVEGENVALTFKGVTTQVRNNSAEIVKYLENIGNTNFAGAMEAQMERLPGLISNLQDNVAGLFREFGNAGATSVLTEGVRAASNAVGDLKDAVSTGWAWNILTTEAQIWFDTLSGGSSEAVSSLEDIKYAAGEVGSYLELYFGNAWELASRGLLDLPANAKAAFTIIIGETDQFVTKMEASWTLVKYASISAFDGIKLGASQALDWIVQQFGNKISSLASLAELAPGAGELAAKLREAATALQTYSGAEDSVRAGMAKTRAEFDALNAGYKARIEASKDAIDSALGERDANIANAEQQRALTREFHNAILAEEKLSAGLDDLAGAHDKVVEAAGGLEGAYKALGLTAPDALKKTANETKAAYDALVAYNDSLKVQPPVLAEISKAGGEVKKSLGNVFTDGKEQAAAYVQGLQIAIANIKTAQVEALKLNDGTAEGAAAYKAKMDELNTSLESATGELKKVNAEMAGVAESAKQVAVPLADIQTAFVKYAEAAIKANQGVADAALLAQAASLGLKETVIAIEQAALKSSPAIKELDAQFGQLSKTAKDNTEAVSRNAAAYVTEAKSVLDAAKAKGDSNEISRAAATLAQAEADAAQAVANAKAAEAQAAYEYIDALSRQLAIDGQISEADQRMIADAKAKADALRDVAAAQQQSANTAQEAANTAADASSKAVTATVVAGSALAGVAKSVTTTWQGMAQQAGVSADQMQRYGDILVDVYDKAAQAQASWLAQGQNGTDPMAGIESSLRQAAEAAQALDDKIAQLQDTGSNTNASLIAENLELKGQYEQAAKVRENALLSEIELNIQLMEVEAQKAALAQDDAAYQAAIKRIAALKEELALNLENIELKKKADAAERSAQKTNTPAKNNSSSSGGSINTTNTTTNSTKVVVEVAGAGLSQLDQRALSDLARKLAPELNTLARRGLS